MRYLLFLDDMAVTLSIGLHDFEKAAAQRVLVCAALVVEMDAGAGDEAGAVYDYDGLHAAILALAADAHVHLQETLCARIMAYAQRQPRVCGGWVRSAKPDVYADVRAVGCQLVWGDAQAQALLALAPR